MSVTPSNSQGHDDLSLKREEAAACISDVLRCEAEAIERIADAVCFFASDASLHCTGVDLPIDGGACAGNFIPGFNTL